MEAPAAPLGPEWSFQRHLVMARCPREYWFEYVSAHDAEGDGELRGRVKALKRLNALAYLTGLAVHLEVRHLAAVLKAGGAADAAESAARMAAWVDEWMAKGPEAIVEARNGATIPDEAFDAVKTRAEGEVRAFLGRWWPQVAQLEGLALEVAGSFAVGDVTVRTRVDALGREEDGAFVIYDWKTGVDDPAYESDLQVAVYALWAREKAMAVEPLAEVRLVFLKEGVERRQTYTGEELDALAGQIQRESAKMSPAPTRGQSMPRPDPRRCLACNFATVCDAADLSGTKRGPWG
jgi:CRISPR/Cas system-associated exonuclease Cas4 (RecB family)